MHPPHGHQRLGVIGVAYRHQRADHRGTAVGDALHLFQQGRHVVVVAFGIAKAGGVVSGLHTRLATEGFDAQARIIGHRRQARLGRCVPGFGQGVFDEGVERLFGFADAECRLGHQLDAEWSKQ